MGRIPKKTKPQLDKEIIKSNGLGPEPVTPEPEPEKEKDERANFVPRDASGGSKQSITIPLKDGRLDIEALTEKRTDSLRLALATPEVRKKLGLVQGQTGEQGITTKVVGRLFGVLGIAEGMAVSISAKIPRDVAIGIMMLNDQEFAKVAQPTANVLERMAPAWLRKMLLSENAELGQLLITFFQIHQAKLEQIKQWKLANQNGGQGGNQYPPIAPVN